ncbi:hypothetical protein HK098_004100 [Nowakowskiella sp. JEL0407]|nr:hypothetical protein HK098_004100 [Nowakowskiella sp. JEL0407]
MNERCIFFVLFFIVCTFNSCHSQTITQTRTPTTAISFNPLTQIRTTPTPTLTTALKKKTFTFTFTFTKFPKPTSLIAAGENRKSSEPSSKVSTLGVAIGISVSLLFVIVSVGSLYFRNRTAQNQKVTPFVFSPGKNIKLESQGSDQFKSTPPVQKLDGNHDGKMYMAPNPPSQTPEQIPQRQPSFNQQANHVSIHQPQMSQYSFQPQSEARDDFTQQSIPAFQRPLNSLPLPMTSKPIQMPLPILESFTVVESSTNSTTESLSVVANRLMDKGSNEK